MAALFVLITRNHEENDQTEVEEVVDHSEVTEADVADQEDVVDLTVDREAVVPSVADAEEIEVDVADRGDVAVTLDGLHVDPQELAELPSLKVRRRPSSSALGVAHCSFLAA